MEKFEAGSLFRIRRQCRHVNNPMTLNRTSLTHGFKEGDIVRVKESFAAELGPLVSGVGAVGVYVSKITGGEYERTYSCMLDPL